MHVTMTPKLAAEIEKQLTKHGLVEIKIENGRIVVIAVKRTATGKF